jgi:hypothetical protein
MPRKKTINPEIIKASESIEIQTFRCSVKAEFSDFPDPRKTGMTYFPAWYLFLVILSGLQYNFGPRSVCRYAPQMVSGSSR